MRKKVVIKLIFSTNCLSLEGWSEKAIQRASTQDSIIMRNDIEGTHKSDTCKWFLKVQEYCEEEEEVPALCKTRNVCVCVCYDVYI